MSIVHAPCDQDPLIILKFLKWRNLASFVFHHESYVRIDTQSGYVFGACILEVTVQNLPKTALLRVRIRVSLVRLQHYYSHLWCVRGWIFLDLIHDVSQLRVQSFYWNVV